MLDQLREGGCYTYLQSRLKVWEEDANIAKLYMYHDTIEIVNFWSISIMYVK
jgi:hypothetical protein